MEVVQLYPAWKNAVCRLMENPPPPGHIITHEWLQENFGLKEPTGIEEYKAMQFELLQAMTAFREALLESHQIALKSVPGKGYEVVAAKDQTKFALTTGIASVKREMAKMASILLNVDHAQLTVDERRENADALAKAAMMRSMFTKAVRLKLPKQDRAAINQ